MRKFFYTVGLAMGVVTLLAVGSHALAGDYPATNLKVQGGWSMGGIYAEYEVPFWKERIPKLSNGKVTSHLTSLDEMGLKGPEVFRLLKLGVIDFGTSSLGYVSGDHAENGAPDLAGVALDAKTARAALEAWRPALVELYEGKYGVKPVMFYPAEAQAFFCNKEIEGLASLKGTKVRVWNQSMADFVEAAGGTTITMSFGEVVPALQRHVIDCAITGTFSGNSAKWHEVSTHFYPMMLGWSIFMYAVSMNTWDRLDPKVRTLLETELVKLENELWDNGAYRTQQGIECNTGTDACKKGTKAGMKLVPLTDADMAVRKKMIEETILARWAKRCGAACTKRWNETVGKVVGMTAPVGK